MIKTAFIDRFRLALIAYLGDGEQGADTPDEQEARGNLHGGGADRGLDKAKERVENLKEGSSLDPDELITNDGIDLGVVTSSGEKSLNSLDKNPGPTGERGPVVGDQVGVDNGVDRLGSLLAGA